MNFESELILKKQKNFLIKICYFSVIAIITLFILKFIVPIFIPFIIAFIIACILSYPIRFIVKKTNLKRGIISILMVIIFFIFTILLVVNIGCESYVFIKKLFSSLPELFTGMFIPFIENIFSNIEGVISSLDQEIILLLEQGSFEVIKSIGKIISGLSTDAVTRLSHIATLIPGIFIKTIITVIATFFITIDFDRIINFIKNLIPSKVTIILRESKRYIFDTVFKCIYSYALIMIITFVEIWIWLSIIGISNAGIIAFTISLFDILPVLGSGGVMIPWVIIAIISGNYKVAIGIGTLYIAITIVRNIIEPKLVGKQVGLHPLITLMSMLLGVHLFGMIGLLGLPILVSLIKSLHDKSIINIFRKLAF